jgi:hypothetical protein
MASHQTPLFPRSDTNKRPNTLGDQGSGENQPLGSSFVVSRCGGTLRQRTMSRPSAPAPTRGAASWRTSPMIPRAIGSGIA